MSSRCCLRDPRLYLPRPLGPRPLVCSSGQMADFEVVTGWRASTVIIDAVFSSLRVFLMDLFWIEGPNAS